MKFKNLNLAIIFVLILAVPVSAQIANRMPVGARPMGMGGAFSAVANDANALYWNPAGIASLQRQEFTSMYSDPYGIGTIQSYLGYVLPITDDMAFGVDWMHFGQDDDGLAYGENFFDLSYGIRLPWWDISLGANFRMLNREIKWDGVSYGNPSGYGFDFGVLMKPFENFRIAFSGTDIGGTSVSYDNDKKEEIFYQQFRFGAAYTPFEGFTVAADVDDRIHFGGEYWLSQMFALRGGLQKDLETIQNYDRGLIYSGGLSAKYKFFQVDYAMESDPDLPISHRFGFSFFFNPSLVSIKSAEIKPVPIFRALYRKYSEDEFAEVVLKNIAQEKLPVRVRLDIPTVTSQPYEEEIILEPQTTKAYPLRISLSNDILEGRGAAYDNLVQPVISVHYEQDKQEKETSRNLDPIYVLGKNKMSWSQPERVAAFITPEDEQVDRFTRTVIQEYNDVIVNQFNNSNLGKALVLFDALSEHGIVYQADRQTPWYLIAADSSIFDNIQYPSELLRSKIGDCDDCTVLFASLLENISIPTILLDVFAPGEGHIYMMFDSGIPVDEIDSHPMNSTEYVIYNDRVWIPVETTMYGVPFSTAWRIGSEEYHKRKEQGFVNEITVAEAKMLYKPGQPITESIEVPLKENIDELVNIDLENYSTRLEEYAMSAGVSMDDPDGVYDAGAAYIRFNRLDDALAMLQRALELRPDFGDAINAVGVIYVKKAQYDRALEFFRRAAELLPVDAGIRVNIAITLYMQGNRTGAEEEYGEAVELDKRYKDLLKFIRPRKKGGDN
ncbi:MAG: tetratricopeptide repeat protein [bacterium]|nr:tetratricopeptide repeat protein [bacterium]